MGPDGNPLGPLADMPPDPGGNTCQRCPRRCLVTCSGPARNQNLLTSNREHLNEPRREVPPAEQAPSQRTGAESTDLGAMEAHATPSAERTFPGHSHLTHDPGGAHPQRLLDQWRTDDTGALETGLTAFQGRHSEKFDQLSLTRACVLAFEFRI